MTTSKVYRAVETALTFQDSGGSAVISLNALAAGAGRVSAQLDRGSGSKAAKHKVSLQVAWQSNPTIGDYAELWMFESDGTYQDGNVGTVDASLGSDKRRNGQLVGTVQCDTASTANMIDSWIVDIMDRYTSFGVWNGSGTKAFAASNNACNITVTPMPPELQ